MDQKNLFTGEFHTRTVANIAAIPNRDLIANSDSHCNRGRKSPSCV